MEYSVLRNEIDKDPMNLGYKPLVDAGYDDDLAKLMNEKTQDSHGWVTPTLIKHHLFLTGLWLIMKASTSQACKTTIAALEEFPAGFNLADPADKAMFESLADALVADTTVEFSEANKTALLELSQVKISRAEVLFGVGTTVQHTDIAQAFKTERGIA